MRKVLITGCSGLTGSKLVKLMLREYELYGFYNERPMRTDVLSSFHAFFQDITDNKSLEKRIHAICPDVIVNLASYNNVDKCETEREKAIAVNSEAVSTLARIANTIKAKLITISTDNVFDGTKDGGYSEEDKPNPINYYGYTKSLGEKYVQQDCSRYCIIRTSNLFGYYTNASFPSIGEHSSSGKTNFGLQTLLDLSAGKKIFGARDMMITPTLADSLADAIAKVVYNDLDGIIHISGLTCIDRYTYTRKLAKRLGYNEQSVIPITLENLNLKAVRPKNCCLLCTKFAKDFPSTLLSLNDSLDTFYDQISLHSPHLLGNNPNLSNIDKRDVQPTRHPGS